ncbi:MAG: hypothetical protein QHI48_12550, partial [Bacteroidota bacterium]|nr:hypothetical protein [Bacteroidota bacterium]
MALYRSFSNSAAAILGTILLAACAAPASIEEEIRAVHREVLVWNDFMPGARPRCHAVMNVVLSNTTPRDIVLRSPQGVLEDAETGMPLRRFTAVMLVDDAEMGEIRLPPGLEVPVTFRTPLGVPPLDAALHPRIVFRVRAETSLERP